MTARKALVVEDDDAARRLLEMLLEKMGFEVRATGDGRDAVALLDELDLDLVCLDLGLPTISGFEVCEAVRASPRTRRVPVLVTTGRYMPQDRALAIRLGADGYLLKPFTPGQFRTAVAAVVGLPKEAPRQATR